MREMSGLKVYDPGVSSVFNFFLFISDIVLSLIIATKFSFFNIVS